MMKKITLNDFLTKCGFNFVSSDLFPNYTNLPAPFYDYSRRLLVSKEIWKNYKNMIIDVDMLELYEFNENNVSSWNSNFTGVMLNILNKHRRQFDKLYQVETFVDEIGVTGLQTSTVKTKEYGDDTTTTSNTKASTSEQINASNGNVTGSSTTFDSSTFKDTDKTITSSNDSSNYSGSETNGGTSTRTKENDVETTINNYMLGLNLPRYLQNEIITSNYDFIGVYARIIANELCIPLYK